METDNYGRFGRRSQVARRCLELALVIGRYRKGRRDTGTSQTHSSGPQVAGTDPVMTSPNHSQAARSLSPLCEEQREIQNLWIVKVFTRESGGLVKPPPSLSPSLPTFSAHLDSPSPQLIATHLHGRIGGSRKRNSWQWKSFDAVRISPGGTC